MKPKVQLNQADVPKLREQWSKDNDYLCPILGIPLNDNYTLDHYHSSRNGNVDIKYHEGCCRGVIHKRVNSFEGRVVKSYIRDGLSALIDLPTLLRKLADYYEYNKLHSEDTLYIHPSEKPKPKKITKTCYNKLAQATKADNKTLNLTYPKSGKLTKPLEKLFKEYNIEITYYK